MLLLDLPDEILETILHIGDHLESGLGYKDIANLSNSCLKFYSIIKKQNLIYCTLERSAILAAQRMKKDRIYLKLNKM